LKIPFTRIYTHTHTHTIIIMGDVLVEDYTRCANSRGSCARPPYESKSEPGEEASGYGSEGISYDQGRDADIINDAPHGRSSSCIISALQLQNEALQAQIRDLTTKLSHSKRETDEADKMCENLRHDLLEETSRRASLEGKVEEYELKMALVIEQAKKRTEDENNQLELEAELEEQRKQLEIQKARNEELQADLIRKEEEIQTLTTSIRASEESQKSKRKIDETWELVHRDDRNRIRDLEDEMQKLRKDNVKLPVMRQQLTHAETQAREMLESMNNAIRKESVARNKCEEAEVKLEQLAELQEMLESERASCEREKMSVEMERAIKELSDKKLAEMERLMSEKETVIGDTQKALIEVERKWNEEKGLREDAIAELNDCKNRYEQALLRELQDERSHAEKMKLEWQLEEEQNTARNAKLLRELEEERTNARDIKTAFNRLEDRIAYLQEELDVKNAQHEADIRAKTLAETALSAIEDRKQLRVDRGCSTVPDEAKLQLEHVVGSLRTTNAELSTQKAIVEKQLVKSQREIDRQKLLMGEVTKQHRILRDDYKRHIAIKEEQLSRKENIEKSNYARYNIR